MASTLLRPISGFSTGILRQTTTTTRTRALYATEPSSGSLPPKAVQSLLKSALSRAKRTLSEKSGSDANGSSEAADEEATATTDLLRVSLTADNYNSTTNNLLSSVTSRAKRTLSTTARSSTSTSSASTKGKEGTTTTTNNNNNNNNNNNKSEFIPTDLRYNQNPAISLTALAQWLWASVLRPHEDSAIDATCGNGHDSTGIAQVLFGNSSGLHIGPEQAQLICIDIQEEACRQTKKVLEKYNHTGQIQILQQSHAPLPNNLNPDTTYYPQPGLVVYNLGYLPNSDKAFQTQVDSTLSSITDALLMIRVGGMVSVMTYPASNPKEDFAVRSLLEASVVLTNKQGPDWNTFIDGLDCDEELKTLLQTQLQRMEDSYQQGGGSNKRTFRVTEHKKIGLTSAPILMTATRIK